MPCQSLALLEVHPEPIRLAFRRVTLFEAFIGNYSLNQASTPVDHLTITLIKSSFSIINRSRNRHLMKISDSFTNLISHQVSSILNSIYFPDSSNSGTFAIDLFLSDSMCLNAFHLLDRSGSCSCFTAPPGGSTTWGR